MLVDKAFSTVGTTNFDFRSFETNFEANAFIYNRGFNSKLEKHFFDDLQNCKEITLNDWQKRGWIYKLREALAHIVSPMY
jgi:cardiolipin synthase